jgi:signal transduction histidine kinase
VLATTFNAMTRSLARFQREAALRERLSSLGRLSTVIAHEIRNPLMIIKSALRSLRRTNGLDEGAASAVADIDEEVARLNALVNGVLDFARPIRFSAAPASLSTLCREAVAATDADGLGTACEVRLDPAADEVVTDAERVRQVLVNVLANARQALGEQEARAETAGTPATAAHADGAVLRLHTEALDGGRVRIVVADRGVGMDAQTLSRVFDPFFTTKTTGTGIGLAISRNIVEGLGGVIRIESQAGAGTQVLIELPRLSSPPMVVNA